MLVGFLVCFVIVSKKTTHIKVLIFILKKSYKLKTFLPEICRNCNNDTNTTQVKGHKVQMNVTINVLGLTRVITQAVYKYSKK